jgi:ABC-2 type transport system permease protein
MRKEFIHLLRDRRSLFAALALPVVLILLYGYAVNYDLESLPFAVVDHDRSQASRRLIEQISTTAGFHNVASRDSAECADRMFQQGTIMAMIVIPPGLERDAGAGKDVAVQVLIDGSNSTIAAIASAYCQGAVEAAAGRVAMGEARVRGVPTTLLQPSVDVRLKVLYNPNLRTRVFLVPGLIGIILMLMSALLTSGIVVREKERGSFELLASSPISGRELIVGKLVPYLVLAMIDVALGVVIGWIVFGVVPQGSLLLLAGVSAVYVAAALALGLLFSCVMPTQQLAMLAAFLTTVLPTVLLAGFAFPIRNMPLPLQWFSQILPATHYIIMMRAIVLKGVGLEVFGDHLAALAAIALILVVLAVRRVRKTL